MHTRAHLNGTVDLLLPVLLLHNLAVGRELREDLGDLRVCEVYYSALRTCGICNLPTHTAWDAASSWQRCTSPRAVSDPFGLPSQRERQHNNPAGYLTCNVRRTRGMFFSVGAEHRHSTPESCRPRRASC